MCGFFGYSSLLPSDHNSIDIDKVFRNLSHRGPDSHDYVSLDQIILAHVRLSILDPSPLGNQPMYNSSSGDYIIYNGEIYNHQNLKEMLKNEGVDFNSSCDTEVILKGFALLGNSFFDLLEGMFSVAIYNERSKILTLARDKFGIKPLLYYRTNNSIAFASELKVLLSCGKVPKQLDEVSVNSFLANGSVRQPSTIIKNVYNLNPGQVVAFDSQLNIISELYLTSPFDYISSPKSTYPEAQEAFSQTLDNAVKKHMVSDVDVGCFLSGGYDSSLLLALASKHSNTTIKSFTIGFENQHEVPDETNSATRIASHIGSDHYNFIVEDSSILNHYQTFIDAIDQPSVDGFNTFLASYIASKFVKVTLSGLGSDELLGGYPHFHSILVTHPKKILPYDRLLARVHQYRPSKITRRSSLRFNSIAQNIESTRTLLTSRQLKKMLNPSLLRQPLGLTSDESSSAIVSSISKYECKNYLLNTLLRDTDSVSMWHSLEVRPVFLDIDFVRFCLSLPDQFKVNSLDTKKILTDSLFKLVPQHFFGSGKLGFEIPFVKWMNGPLNLYLQFLLNSPAAKFLLSSEFYSQLYSRAISRHFIRSDWHVLILIGWVHKFIDA